MSKKEDWFNSIGSCQYIETKIKEAEEVVASLRDDRVILETSRDKCASDYAAERAAEGANAVEGPDGALYTIRKARKKKGGAEPPNAYLLEPVKR